MRFSQIPRVNKNVTIFAIIRNNVKNFECNKMLAINDVYLKLSICTGGKDEVNF